MLIAIGSHGNMDENGKTNSEGFNTERNIDMNYEAYQECKKPKELFTYMNRSATISNTKGDMKMAYMDARLIAKPESDWLTAETIKE